MYLHTKKILHSIITSLFFATLLTNCSKEKNFPLPDPNAPLPNASQNGKGIIACKINNSTWWPVGYGKKYESKINNTSLLVSKRLNVYDFSIQADQYQKMGTGFHSINLLELRIDSFQKSGIYTINATNPKVRVHYVYGFPGFVGYGCGSYQFNTPIKGFINITKFDTTQKIISGLFEASIPNIDTQKCGDSVRITEGRFDYKF